MKKILAILLLVSAVVTIPTMANAKAEPNSDTTNHATNVVAVSLDDARQSNSIGTNVAASGSNNNAAVANQNTEATAKNANTGDAKSKSGDANSGNAVNKVINIPINNADASNNHLKTGDVDNTVIQNNEIKQTVPVRIHNNQIIHK